MRIAHCGQEYGDVIERLKLCNSSVDLEHFMSAFLASMGLKNAAYIAAPKKEILTTPSSLFCTYSKEWIDRYLANEYYHNDPVIDYATNNLCVIDWNELSARDDTTKTFFGEAREFQVGEQGVVIPVTAPNDCFALLSLTADSSKREWKSQCRSFAPIWIAIAYSFHQRSILLSQQNPIRKLSNRESQCLQLLAYGKIAKQIGFELGISESAVRLYLTSARYKLNAVNLNNAISIATKLDIITFLP